MRRLFASSLSLASSLFVTVTVAGCAARPPAQLEETGSIHAIRTATPTARPTGPVARPPSGAPPQATEDYLVAPRDQLSVQVHGQDDLTRTVRVSEKGTITLPLVGEIKASGLSPREIETAVENALKPAYLQNPRVTVTVSEFRGRTFSVVGAVNRPGAYPILTNEVTLLQALSEAQGTRENAARVAYVVRAKPRSDEPQAIEVDLDALLRTGRAGGVRLESGDSVYVPEANVFYVTGAVEKRGAYTLRRDTTLSKAIAEAGGVTKIASHRVTILRTGENGKREEITGLDLDLALKGDSKADLPLMAQDVVVVPTHGGKATVYGVIDALRGALSIGLVP